MKLDDVIRAVNALSRHIGESNENFSVRVVNNKYTRKIAIFDLEEHLDVKKYKKTMIDELKKINSNLNLYHLIKALISEKIIIKWKNFTEYLWDVNMNRIVFAN